MTGTQLHTMLLEHGASLSLDAHGQLTVKPAQVAEQYRAAIQQHLCYLLVCAAIAEVKRLPGVDSIPLISTQLLSAAAGGGEVETTRQAACTYVRGWKAALQGAQHDTRL